MSAGPQVQHAQQTVPVLALVGIKKSFNIGQTNETEILHGIDLTLEPGEFCAVIGPSGSGKSTLLNSIGLLDRPSLGSLRINGVETTSMNDAELTHLRGHQIGFVFQYHHLLTAFTALENVMMPMYANVGFFEPRMQERAMVLLDKVGLKPWLHSPSSQLSGGQQQRVAVARALVMQPSLILADEPTGNLDSKSADKVFDLLREVCRENKTAVLFVTHNPLLSARCDRTIRVEDGQIARD